MCSNVLAVGLAAALISATTAQAADLPRSKGQATAPAAFNNWTGFYAGLVFPLARMLMQKRSSLV